MKLDWSKLLNGIRRKELDGSSEVMGTAAGRLELERDYDRILFAAPTRRLADKTQVFPMEANDSVRNRLTHSHEVSNLARSIGIKLAFDKGEQIFGPECDSELHIKRNIPAVLAAIGLAHDLGNPPFGHQGESSIQKWFKRLDEKESVSVPIDFIEFDGNAQTFRLLTQLQVLNDSFGLNLAVGTLAALLKYPSVYGSNKKGGYKKYGVFQSEQNIATQVWEQTGLTEGLRHPLAYIMEACDDIAYSVIDAEDTVKKGYASFYDLMDFLMDQGEGDAVIKQVVERSKEKNKIFKRDKLSSKELNDISMQMFRVTAISVMIPAATNTFVNNVDSMMNNSLDQGFELIENSNCDKLCKTLKAFDLNHGFKHRDVLKLELQGSNYINGMLDILWEAVNQPDTAYNSFIFNDISENYRRIYQSTDKETYAKCQIICDAISGMTESYLIKKYDEYKSLINAVC